MCGVWRIEDYINAFSRYMCKTQILEGWKAFDHVLCPENRTRVKSRILASYAMFYLRYTLQIVWEKGYLFVHFGHSQL